MTFAQALARIEELLSMPTPSNEDALYQIKQTKSLLWCHASDIVQLARIARVLRSYAYYTEEYSDALEAYDALMKKGDKE